MKSFAFLRHGWGVFIVLILSFWAIQSLLIPGFFPIHDDTQVARVFEMGKALSDGVFPVRWVSDLGYGYGYPLFNFYAPLAYYVGGFFTLLGFDVLLATKIMMGVGILFSGIFMYFLAREFWGEIGGIISGLFYVYAPYHALDIYVRGAVGEFWAYAFIPLAALGFYKVFQNRAWKWVVVGSIGYAGVILSHNLTAMLVTPFLIIVTLLVCYIAEKGKKLSTLTFQLSTLTLGLLLSAFYWLPALLEMKYTNVLSQIGGGADFRDHFVCIQQLWESHWGFGGSTPGCVDGLSFKIGKLHIIASLIAFIGGIYTFKKDKARLIIIIFSFLFLLLPLFMTLEISKPIWETISPMAFLQYPWRFLLLASFFSSVLAGFPPLLFQRPLKQGLFATGLILLLLYLNLNLFTPQTILSKSSADYTNKPYLNWTTSKISDEYMPKGFRKPSAKEELPKATIGVLKGEGTAKNILTKTGRISAAVKAQGEIVLKLNVAYFPAWKLFLDGEITNFTIGNDGVYVEVPKGSHLIEARFNQAPIEQLSNMASIIGVLLLFTGIIYIRRKQALYEHKKTKR